MCGAKCLWGETWDIRIGAYALGRLRHSRYLKSKFAEVIKKFEYIINQAIE